MIIHVASTNPIKVESVKEVVQEYALLKNAVIQSIDGIEAALQPLTLEETTADARWRAEKSFRDCDYSVGIASGFCKIPETNNDYWDITICSVYDGKKHHIGISSGYQVPPKLIQLIFEKKMTLQQACKTGGLTDKDRLGAQEGCAGVLTSGRITRKSSTKQALYKAFIFIEHQEWF